MAALFAELDIILGQGAGKFMEIPPDLIKVDHTYQRPFSQAQYRAMLRSWEPVAFGTILISERKEGDWYAIDGQHRIQLWKDKMPGKPIPCIVHRGLTIEQESRVFTVVNNSRYRPSALDNFKARLSGKDPIAEGIAGLLAGYGLAVAVEGKSSSFGMIAAIGVVEKLFRKDRTSLSAALSLITDLWGGEAESLTGVFIGGFERFHSRYCNEYRRDELIRRIRNMKPSGLSEEVRRSTALTNEQHLAFALTLAYLYNRGKGKNNRLSDWQQDAFTGPGSRSGVQRGRVSGRN